MDAYNGNVITSLPIGVGVNYAAFDPQDHLIFLSCGDGTLNIFHEKSADAYEDAGPVKTQPERDLINQIAQQAGAKSLDNQLDVKQAKQ